MVVPASPLAFALLFNAVPFEEDRDLAPADFREVLLLESEADDFRELPDFRELVEPLNLLPPPVSVEPPFNSEFPPAFPE